jgi:hypothetical protein
MVVSQISIIDGLTYIPFMGYGVLIILTILLVFNRSVLSWYSRNFRLRTVPSLFLIIGILGGFWVVLLSFVELQANSLDIIQNLELQNTELTKALVITSMGIGFFFLAHLIITLHKKLNEYY